MLMRRMLLAVGLSAALMLAACGDEPEPTSNVVTTLEDPTPPAAAVDGEIEDDEIEDAETESIDEELLRASAIRATTLVGLDVEDGNAEHVGVVEDAFVIVADGTIQYVVVAASGIEGALDDWALPLPVSEITVSGARDTLIVSTPMADLVNAPGFGMDVWPDLNDEDWDLDIQAFWADITEPLDDGDEPMDDEATATPMPEEEAESEDDGDATATPVAEEEAEEADMDDEATATPMPEEEAESEDDADATATPVAEEEAVEADMDDEASDEEITVREPHALSLERLLEFEVNDPAGESLGNVEDLVINWDEGRIEYLVLSFGGFLGLGESWFAFPWGELVFDPVENAFVTTATEEMLEDAPGFDSDNWPNIDDPDWDDQFFEFWNE